MTAPAATATVCAHPDGCARVPIAMGWCRAHYLRVRRTGDPGKADVQSRPPRGSRPSACSIEGCGAKHDGHGYCSKHLKRWRRDGDLRRGRPSGAGHHRWAADRVTYAGAHIRVSNQRGPAAEYGCARCSCPAEHWAYDHADPAELLGPNPRNGVLMPYSGSPTHYVPMCRSCHVAFDRSITAA